MQNNNCRFQDGAFIADLVRNIETSFKGIWYSIYQRSGRIEIHFGVTPQCENETLRLLCLYDDKTLIVPHPNDFSPPSVDRYISEIRDLLERKIDDTSLDESKVRIQIGDPRIQDESDLSYLASSWDSAVESIRAMEQYGFVFRELHIGSCLISADASLRGHIGDCDVDCMADLLEGSIAESLDEVIRETALTVIRNQAPYTNTTADVPYSFGTDLHPGFAKIVEESGELLEVIGKILVIGGSTIHWTGDLRKALHSEMADVSAALDFYVAQPENMSTDERQLFFKRKMTKLAKFENWQANPDPLPECGFENPVLMYGDGTVRADKTCASINPKLSLWTRFVRKISPLISPID